MRPTLRQLEYVVAVADTGRFNEAARRCNVSQPSLSAQISDAETTLGVTLIERARSGAVLTPLGHVFVRRARQILRDVADLKAAMQVGPGDLAGRFQLGVLPSIGPYLLPGVVKALHASYPGLRLVVHEGSTMELQRQLSEGVIDAAISTAEDHPECNHAELFEERLWICAAPDDRLAGQGSVRPADLSARALLTVGFGHRLAVTVQKIADASGAHVSADFRGTSLDAIRQMAAMGAGLAILPSIYALSEARRDPDLVLRPIEDALARRVISLNWRKASPLADWFEVIADALRDGARELQADQ